MTTQTKWPDPIPGMILPNGAEVLKAKQAEVDTLQPGDAWVVLCDWMCCKGQYVTWRLDYLPDGRVSTYWGHYFSNSPESYEAALRDFEARK